MIDNFAYSAGRKAPRAVAALLMGTILVGCTAPGNLGPSRYEPTYLRLTEQRVFAQALRRHYLELATNAYDRGDLDRSDFYSLRALMAAEGKLAQPAEAVRHNLSGTEAGAAGERLNMLMMTGVRLGSPDLAARAQAAYDCWLLETGPSGDPAIAQSCRFNALNALAQLEGASSNTQLVNAGGPAVPQGQTYVIEPGMQPQTINAPAGFTIEVITTQGGGYVPHHFQQERAPATYSTVQAPAPMMVEAAPMMVAPIQTVPMVSVQDTAIMTTEMAQFEPAPMIEMVDITDQYAMAAPMPVETMPVETMMMEQAGPPMNIIPMPMQATMFEEPTIDLGPIETAPVFGADQAPSMPMIEMAAFPMVDDQDAASALIDATANMRGDFAVFFGFDSDEVTLEAEDVLIDTIEEIKLSGATRVTLMGYTDSVGDARYNQLLAMRRAQAVRQFLQRQLGTSVTFEILPVGEVQAVQNGGDGVMEALNRKVEVMVSR